MTKYITTKSRYENKYKNKLNQGGLIVNWICESKRRIYRNQRNKQQQQQQQQQKEKVKELWLWNDEINRWNL